MLFRLRREKKLAIHAGIVRFAALALGWARFLSTSRILAECALAERTGVPEGHRPGVVLVRK